MTSAAILVGLYCLRPPGQCLQMAGCLLLRPLLWGPHCVCVCVVLIDCVQMQTKMLQHIFAYMSTGQGVCVCMGLWRARGDIKWDTSVTFLQSPHQSIRALLHPTPPSTKGGVQCVSLSEGLARPRSLGLSQNGPEETLAGSIAWNTYNTHTAVWWAQLMNIIT